MGVSKVVYGNTPVIDITDSTVTSQNLLSGVVAYGANGNRIVGEVTTETVVVNPSGEATDELEKLQVGNTIYSLPTGGGVGFTKVALYEISGITPESVVTLSQSMANFDLIEIVTLYGHEDQNDYKQNAIYNSDELIASIGTARPINWHVGNDTVYTWIYVTDVDEFTIHSASGQTGLGIWYVYGYKFGGGSGKALSMKTKTYTGDGNSSYTLTLDDDPVMLWFSGEGGDNSTVTSYSTPIQTGVLHGDWFKLGGAGSLEGGRLSYDSSTKTLSVSGGSGDMGVIYNYNGGAYTLYYIVEASAGGGGTEVIANPSEEPTDSLSSVQIGDTVYSIEGGGGESWTDITGILTAGQTSITLQSTKIKTTSVIDVYTDTFGVNPIDMQVEDGTVVLSFRALTNNVGVMIRITKVAGVHEYDIPLDRTVEDKVWFYWDTAYVYIDGGSYGYCLISKPNQTPYSWTSFGSIGIDLNYYTIPSDLSSIKVHFVKAYLQGYTAVRFMNSSTLYSGGQSGNDAMLRMNGFYQWMDNTVAVGIDEADYTLEISCSASDLTNRYLYIMAADGMIPNTTSGYNNSNEGTFDVRIDGIDFVTGGGS